MLVEQHKTTRELFFVRLTLDEYEDLRSCDKDDKWGISETLKRVINAGIHQDQT